MHDIGPFIKSTKRCYKAIAILTLNTIVILGGMELTSFALLRNRSALTVLEEEPPDARAQSSYYTSKTWARQYWKEFILARRQRYHAFNVWRRAAFEGQTINVDARGVRLTPGADCRPGSFKVFTFGSSHMWGTGAPDWGTIPAYLQAGLQNSRGGPICVTNFGESGYVSTQSVIELILQLQAGNIPNVTAFMDGAGDIYAAYQSGRATEVHENFELTAARVERRDVASASPIFQLLESSSLFRLVRNQVSKLSAGPPPAVKLLTYETMNVDKGSLAKALTATYLSNYKTVAALAQRYGFEYYFFWPSHISSGKKSLTIEEEVLKRAADPSLLTLYEATYQALEPRFNADYSNLFRLTDVFDDCKSLIWLDDFHTTPVGNEMIAQRMMRVMSEHQSQRERQSLKSAN
jgi:hypothetical protein